MVAFQLQHEKNLIAFIAALGKQEDSLPAGLQAQLHSIGQNLENRVVELPTVAASLPGLQKAYQEALSDTQAGETKPGAKLVSTSSEKESDELRDRAIAVLTDSDPVRAARKSKIGSVGQMASNPIKQLFNRGSKM